MQTPKTPNTCSSHRTTWLSALFLSCLTLACSAGPLITLTNSDAINTSSFTNGTFFPVTNWDNNLPPAAGNDYLVPAGKTLRTPGVNAMPYAFAGDSLNLAGSLLMKGSNLIVMPNMILSNGTIINGDPGTTPKITRVAGAINIVTNGIIKGSETNRTVAVMSTLTGSGNLAINDRGFVTLSGAHSFNGPITVTSSTFDLDGTASLTPSSLLVGKDSNTANSTNYNYATNIVRAGGSLNVGYGPGGDLRVGYRTTSQITNSPVAVLDVSSQPQFTANVGNFGVGQSMVGSSSTGASAAGYVYLATNNTIVATNIIIGDTVEGTSPLQQQVILGRGSNYIDSPSMVIGARKQRALMTLPSGGTLVLTNSNGRMDLTVGGNNVGTSANPVDLADFSGGPLVASLGNLVLGQKTGGSSGGAIATLTLSSSPANFVDVNDITLGTMAGNLSGTTSASGTLNINGGLVRVNNSLTLGSWDFTYGMAQGFLNLNAGTLDIGGSILGGGGTNIININGGVLSVAGDIQDSWSGGATTINVNNGVLDLQPAGDSAAGTLTTAALAVNGVVTNASNVTVGTLSGSGTIYQSGLTTVSGNLNPGAAGAVGTLSVGSLSFNPGAVFNVQLNNTTTVGSGVNDLLNITGDLGLNSAALNIIPLASGLATGTYRLANFTGEAFGTLQLPAFGRYTLSLSTDITTTPKHLNLTVSGNPLALRWVGDQNGSLWDVATTQNWVKQSDNSPQLFYDTDAVLFNDESYYSIVSVESTVQPGSIVVSNSTYPYTFSSSTGAGRISGAGGLTKQGLTSLTIGTSNDFTGPVLVSQGQLILGSTNALGATNGMTTVANGATLDVNGQSLGFELVHAQGTGSDTLGAIVNNGGSEARNGLRYLVLDGPTTLGGLTRWDVRGNGAAASASLQGGTYTLTKSGQNVIALTAGCDVNVGDIYINEGSIAFEGASTMNAGYIIDVASGAAMNLYRLTTPLTRNINLGDAARLRSTDASNGANNTVTGTITLSGAKGYLECGGPTTNVLNVAGPIVGPGQLIKSGANLVTISSANNTWAGGTWVSSGTLQVGTGGANGSLPDQPVTNNGTLLYNSTLPLTLTKSIDGPGTWQLQGPGSVTLAGQITGASRFNIYSNGNLTISGTIDTSSSVMKYGDSILTLLSSNSFPGSFAAGSGAPSPAGTSGGIIRLLNPYGFGDPSISKTVSIIRAEVRLEGGISIPPSIYFQTSAQSNSGGAGLGLVAFRNVAGTNTIPNPVELIGGAGSSEYSSDAGLLVFDGPMYLGYTSGRSAIFSGLGDGTLNGIISNDATNSLTVEKRGPGTWTLNAANTYTGPTLVSAGKLLVNGSIGTGAVTVQAGGTLGGTGAINGAVTVQTNGTLAPGVSVGTLTVNNNLTLQGITFIEIGRNGAVLTSDAVGGIATCTYGGTLVVTNIGSSALVPGDVFKLFTAASYAGSFNNIVSPAGYTFTNNLAADGTIGVASVTSGEKPKLNYSISGNTLSFSWTGPYVLLAQTNALGAGLGTTWYRVPGGSTSPVTLQVNPANPTVFYGLGQ